MRAYPVKAKAEVAALSNLTKGFTAIEKNRVAELKGGQPMAQIETHFQLNNELSPTICSLMKHVASSARAGAAGDTFV